MAIEKENFIMTNQEYDQGILLEEYNGKYSLTSAFVGNDGQVRIKWCYRQEKDKATNQSKPGKSIPIKIEIGSKEEAIQHLTGLLSLMGGSQDADRVNGGAGQDAGFDDVPW